MTPELEHTFVDTNGIKLHVVLSGPENGKPVFLLHGFPEFWYGWRHQIPALAEAGYRVIVPDQRGYNLSDKPEKIKSYRTEELVADLLGLVDYFGYGRIDLMGHDWGAAVAWLFAATYPDRVGHLSILNVPHPAVMRDFLVRSPKQWLKSWYIAFFQIPYFPEWLLSSGSFYLCTRLLLQSSREGSFSRVDMERYKVAWTQPRALTSMIHWYRALALYRPATRNLSRIRPPTLILWGRKDVALRHEMAQASLAYCDSGKLILFEDATHWIQHDKWEEVNRNLLLFLKDEDISPGESHPAQ